jgi:hypothetical protein
MQDTYKLIFDIATKELPRNIQHFIHEDAILHRGFKISLDKKGNYNWFDTRYSNYYEKVDPLITKRIIEVGFVKTLGEVMNHSDKEKVLAINRDIESIEDTIKLLSKDSTKLWSKYNQELKKTKNNENLNKGKKKQKLTALRSKYESDKSKRQKSRNLLVGEKEALKVDLNFFSTRIKMYNN